MIEYKNNKTHAEVYEELRQALNNRLVLIAIDCMKDNQTLKVNIREEICSIKSPSELDDILEAHGWIREDFDDNGWSQDTWYWYSHPDYPFGLTMYYSGFYGDLELYRSDIDDYV